MAHALWEGADGLVSCRLLYPESRAALASARRSGRVTLDLAEDARGELERRWDGLDVVELDDALSRAAGDVADAFALRAGDAIHLAAALELRDPELVVATWDGQLRRAALDAGLAVAP